MEKKSLIIVNLVIDDDNFEFIDHGKILGPCLMAVPKLFTSDNVSLFSTHVNARGNMHHGKFETNGKFTPLFGHHLANL